MTKSDIRCPVCNREYNAHELHIRKVMACPNCGTNQPAVHLAEDVWIKINWAELRVLAIYAQRWAATFDLNNGGNKLHVDTLKRIIQDLYAFRPAESRDLNASIQVPQVAEEIEVRRHYGIPSPFFKKRPEPPEATH